MYVCVCIQEPVERKLGSRMVLVRSVSRPYLKIKHDFTYQIPLIESLQHLFKQHHLLEEVSTCDIDVIPYSGKVWWGKFGELTLFEPLVKESLVN